MLSPNIYIFKAVQDELTALAAVFKTATDAKDKKERQDAMRIRHKHILEVTEALSFQILTLALQNYSAKLDLRNCASRLADETRAHMCVLKRTHFQGERATIVFPNFVTCTLVVVPDHRRRSLSMHMTYSCLSSVLIACLVLDRSSLCSCHFSFDEDRCSQPIERFNQINDPHFTAARPSTSTSSL